MATMVQAPPVRYAKTTDGYSIAFSVTGEGFPLILMLAASSHVQLNWSPAHRLGEWLPGLAERFRVVCYDGRGQGMSERGLTSDYSMSSLIKDLEAVVSQVQVEHFVLMGSHATGHAAISYAASHPEQVHSLILTPTSVSGRDWSVIVNVDLAGQNWEFFLSFFNQYTSAPEACAENVEILRKSVDQADWLTMARVWRDSDVEKLLPRILAPTLLLHPREYLNIPLEKSARVAALIPNARLSLIEGRSSFGDASSGLKAIDDFLAEHAGRPAMSVRPFPASLSYREIEVLRLIAAGRSNQQIADELVISLNTARKHVANILAKTGTANRTEAAAYAHDHALT